MFRRLFLEHLEAAYRAGHLVFFGHLQHLSDPGTWATFLKPLRQVEWVVYAKQPFAGPEAVLAYLSRYTHRVAISNHRLIAYDAQTVTFKWKDYRAKKAQRYKTMRLTTDEFIRRFLLHVLPSGFHRIRYFGIFANPQRAHTVQQIRALLVPDPDQPEAVTHRPVPTHEIPRHSFLCPTCRSPMIIIEVLTRSHIPRAPPA